MNSKRGATEGKSKIFQIVAFNKRGATEGELKILPTVASKRGATEWTVGKLMAIILAVVLLALIIYGVSTGAINPLKERVVGMYDNVLGMFGMGDGEGEGVTSVPRSIDIGGSYGSLDGTFSISKSTCRFTSLEVVASFEGLSSVEWMIDCTEIPYDAFVSYSEFYFAAMKFGAEKIHFNSYSTLAEESATDVYLQIYAKSEGWFDSDPTMKIYWNKWGTYVTKGDESIFKGDSNSINDQLKGFYDYSTGGINSVVYYDYTGSSYKRIDEAPWSIGSNGKLDSEEKFDKFRKKVIETVVLLRELAARDSVDSLNKKVKDSTFSFDEKQYSVTVILDESLMMVFENKEDSNDVFGLKLASKQGSITHGVYKKQGSSWVEVVNPSCFSGVEDISGAKKRYLHGKVREYLKENCK